MQAGLIGLALALPAAPTPAQTRVREIHNQRLPVIRPLFAPIVEVSRRILSNTLMRMQPSSRTPNPGSLSGLASRSSTSTGASSTGDSMHLASPCEVDCQPAICVRRILVTNRWILAISMCGAKYLAGGAHPQKDVLVIACAAALITVAVVHLGLRIRILPMLELSCATTALGCISFVGFRAAAAAIASPEFPALVLAVTCAAGAAYCVRRIVSPGASDLSRASVTRILSHGSVEERNMGVDPLKTAGWSLRLLVALLSTFTLVPDGQLGPFTSIAAGTGAFWWLATSTIPRTINVEQRSGAAFE